MSRKKGRPEAEIIHFDIFSDALKIACSHEILLANTQGEL